MPGEAGRALKRWGPRAVGVCLVLAAVPGLFVQLTEEAYRSAAYARYTVSPVIGNRAIVWAGHRLTLDNESEPNALRVPGGWERLAIRSLILDGSRIDLSPVASVPPDRTAVLRVDDSESGKSYLAIGAKAGSAINTLWIADDGKIARDTFQVKDHYAPATRAVIFPFLSSELVGFYSDRYARAPWMLVPFVYPDLLGAFGIAILIVSIANARVDQRRRRRELKR